MVRLNRIVLLLSLLSLPIGFAAQWNSIGDSLVLPTFMLGGTYSPGVSAVDVDGDGWEDLTFGNDRGQAVWAAQLARISRQAWDGHVCRRSRNSSMSSPYWTSPKRRDTST